jgi:hypothetical protein
VRTAFRGVGARDDPTAHIARRNRWTENVTTISGAGEGRPRQI